jgi:rhamnose transport system permease protein
MTMLQRYRPEASAAFAIATLALVLALVRPAFFSSENLFDLFLANSPVLVAALGATLVIVSGEIDISVGSIFAIAGVMGGITAKAGQPILLAAAASAGAGAILGAFNGALTAYARIPSIIVTLATAVALRDGLRWATEGAWVENLPPSFQWLGLDQSSYPLLTGAIVAALWLAMLAGGSSLRAGRAVYATGSNAEGARLAGFNTSRVKLSVFILAGALAGVAAILNAARFTQIPSNAGLGLEMKVIASVVVGGAAITGGRGTAVGTLLGVALLGMIGPSLTFLGVSAYWERAIQGAIILAALATDAARARDAATASRLADA